MPTSTQDRSPRPSAGTTAAAGTCCGSRPQVIELRGGDEPLRLVRCATCGSRAWHLGEEQVRVDTAFEVLATAYRAAPRQARAARDRAASQTTARAVARARAAAAVAPAARTVDRDSLADLLSGWSVLGATA